jgi:hypothetical protein
MNEESNTSNIFKIIVTISCLLIATPLLIRCAHRSIWINVEIPFLKVIDVRPVTIRIINEAGSPIQNIPVIIMIESEHERYEMLPFIAAPDGYNNEKIEQVDKFITDKNGEVKLPSRSIRTNWPRGLDNEKIIVNIDLKPDNYKVDTLSEKYHLLASRCTIGLDSDNLSNPVTDYNGYVIYSLPFVMEKYPFPRFECEQLGCYWIHDGGLSKKEGEILKIKLTRKPSTSNGTRLNK